MKGVWIIILSFLFGLFIGFSAGVTVVMLKSQPPQSFELTLPKYPIDVKIEKPFEGFD